MACKALALLAGLVTEEGIVFKAHCIWTYPGLTTKQALFMLIQMRADLKVGIEFSAPRYQYYIGWKCPLTL